MKRTANIMLGLVLAFSMFTGCNSVQPDEIKQPTTNKENNTSSLREENKEINKEIASGTDTPVEVDIAVVANDMFTKRDYEIEYSKEDSIVIQLNGDSATESDNSVKINGSTVTITKDANYIISGTLENGMIIVNAPDTAKIQIVLDNVNITSKESSPLYILEADKVFLTTASNSVNTLSSGDSFIPIDENNMDAAIYSKEDLTMNGAGTLVVNAPAGHGIVSKDDLVITSGTYTINAASHGLNANDSVRIVNAKINITAGKDGIHAENNEDTEEGFIYIASGTIEMEAEGDGMSARADLQIENGTIRIVAGGGYENGTKQSSGGWGGFMGGKGGFGGGRPSQSASTTETDDGSTSMKGLKSGKDMRIANGTFVMDCADDALHSNANLVINGGTFTIATGDDALHAEEQLDVTAGTIEISNSKVNDISE